MIKKDQIKKTKNGDVMTRFWYTYKNLQPYVYYEYIKFVLKILYMKYIMSILHMCPRFILLRLNDFDIMVPINV